MAAFFRGRYRYVIALLLFAAATINYIDRQSISIAERELKREFAFTPQQYGDILSWFFLAYAIGQVVTGWIVDRIGARKGFGIAVAFWSLANMAHALGTGVRSFSALRFGLGLFEAANYPAALKAISQWFPKAERSTAVGLVNAGVGFGAIVAGPFVAWLVITTGWRGAFVLTGALGLIWLAFWLLLYGPPETHPGVTDDERRVIAAGAPSTDAGVRATLWSLLQRRETWGLMLSRFVADGAFYFFATWLPKYLGDVRGLSLAQIGWVVSIPFIAADLGSVVGGFAGTALIRRGLSIDASRKLLMWAGALLVPVSLLALRAETPVTALVWIGVGMFGIQVKSASLFTVPADIFAAHDLGLAWGLSGAAGSYGASLFTPLVGYLVTHDSYAPVFWIVSVMHLLSCLIVTLFLPSIGGDRIPTQPEGTRRS
jgi:ACS family hexuronate transporter-like MFS transporter